MAATADDTVSSVSLSGITLDLMVRGAGRPLLFLHPETGLDVKAPVFDRLAQHARVIAPTHPAFSATPVPGTFNTIDDLAYLYLDLLDHLDLRDVIVVGPSLGGWIAAAMAIKSTARMSRLVLANPVGIKASDRATRDIVDIFALLPEELDVLAFHDPAKGRRDYKTMPEAELLAVARAREATARYGWSPYLHDPKLKERLRRIDIPTLVLWGTSDRLVKQDYGRAYCAAIPAARFSPIERAGHFPHIEQPDEFARQVLAFGEEQ
jgi:pimeloyl-ACP methyl ester carboxylesterase